MGRASSERLLDRECWAVLQRILRNEYWRSAWIVQEIVLARALILVYGNNTLGWDHQSSISQLLDGLQRWPSSSGAPAREAVLDPVQFWPGYAPTTNRLKESEPPTGLHRPTMAQLVDLRPLDTRATQPRDRIFSLLALCSDADAAAHQPAYDEQTLDRIIYARATRHSIQQGQLHPLLLAGRAYHLHTSTLGSPASPSALSPSLAGLPSWVPDLSRWHEPREGNPKVKRACSMHMPLEHSVSPDLERLSMRGTHACTS